MRVDRNPLNKSRGSFALPSLRQSQLRNLADAANPLHGNFYKRKVLLNADTIREGVDDVELMLNFLKPLVD